jgi:putative phosphoesterase
MMRIGVIADTHIPDRTDDLPAEIFDILRGVSLILHAGDICQQQVLDRLAAVAPVIAVRGNRDDASLGLPERTTVAAGPYRIGLVHGTRTRSQERADRLRYLGGDHRFIDQRRYVRQAFAHEDVQCIIFGHTHQVCNEIMDGILLFNPGGVVPSPGGGPSSVGLLEIDGGIRPLIVPLRHPPRRLSVSEQFWGIMRGQGKNA